MTATVFDAFPGILRVRLTPPAWVWLEAARARVADAPLDPLLAAYAGAGLRIGRASLALDAGERRTLEAAAPGAGFDHWTLEDAARVTLLGARRDAGRTGGDFVTDATACYAHGDAREQQSWLRALSFWPEAADLLPSAIDGCRTAIVPLFEAVACENPYPARYFPDRNFNQMVLKALFNAIALSRVVGLAARVNAEMSRMAGDYAAERTAAGRTVPADIGLAMFGANVTREQS